MINARSQVIGICTWTLGIDDLELLMSTIAGMGFNGVQYCESIDLHTAADVKAMAAKYQLCLIINDPFDCRPGPRNGEASLTNAISYYQRAIDFAAELGCGQTLQGLGAWTMHCKDQQAGWQFIVTAVQALSAYAKSKNVPLSYEPCNLYEVPFVHTAAEFEQLVDESGCSEMTVLLDSFHMNIGEKSPYDVAESYAARNAVFHISGANREGISQSHIDFHRYYDALRNGGFDGPVVMECVLSGNPVNTPPRNENEMTRLANMLIESRQIWQRFR
ncbi:MAG: sugar phosphate isomerase/epimerase family protein [Pseudomonadota bacterium]|nr:sugar phosphate isomerase/epimerase family protein [Pseudomonadota bacterium]